MTSKRLLTIIGALALAGGGIGGGIAAASSGAGPSYQAGYNWGHNVGGPEFLQNCGDVPECTSPSYGDTSPSAAGTVAICQSAVSGGYAGFDDTDAFENGCEHGYSDYLAQQNKLDDGPPNYGG